ncbi:ion transporter [bacterium]|nr:ion transporter [bacterium]
MSSKKGPREIEFGEEFGNPMRGSTDSNSGGNGKQEAFESEDLRNRSLSPSKTMDNWGNLTLEGITSGLVDEFIVNWCKNACASKWLETGILIAILINTYLLAAAGPATTLSEDKLYWMMVADIVLTIIFTVEMFIRIIALGFWDLKGNDPIPRYMNDDWNKMDFFVVISSWLNIIVEATGIELGVSMSSLRALRIMRVLKAFKSIEGIRIILATISAAMPHTVNVVFFLIFLFVVSGIIGVQMFRGLTRYRCEYSSFDLMGQLAPDRYPIVGGPFEWNGTNGTISIDAATIFNESAPGPFPRPVDEPTYEYPIGIGVWSTYCAVDEDCPLFEMSDLWGRTQTCQPSLNPGKTFSNYDSAGEAYITLFINMACLYWWETAHRYSDANSLHDPFCTGVADDPEEFPSCADAFASSLLGTISDCPEGCRYSAGGPGSMVAWAFGALNVFLLTMVSVNMFVAAVTTIFMDQRSAESPDGGAVAPKDVSKAKKQQRAEKWTAPPYYNKQCGGEGPYVESLRGKIRELIGALEEAKEEEAKWPGSRDADIPKIEGMVDAVIDNVVAAGGSVRGSREEAAQSQGWINQGWFDQFILGFIMINTVALAAEHHDREECVPMQEAKFATYDCENNGGCEPSLQVQELCQSPNFIANMKIANYIFNFVFTVEMIMKILGMGFKEYIRVAFNKLDFFIVVTSTFDMIGELMADPADGASGPSIFKLFRVFRLFRVLRVARILYRNENLKRVLQTVFGSGAPDPIKS